MHYVTMDPELVRKSVEGIDDELAGEVKKLEAFYRQFRCTRCKGALHKEFLPQHMYADPDCHVARAVLRCNLCKSLFDPFSGIILETGDPRAVHEKTGPIIKPSFG